MQEFENIVIKCCQEVVSENHSDIEVDMDTCLTNELGFDSLGIVSLVLLLEEKLEMDLDEYLMEIRNFMKRFKIFNVFGEWIQKLKIKVRRKKYMEICIDFIIRKDTALQWYEQKIHEKIDGIDLDLSITQNSTKMILVGNKEKIYKILYAVWELLYFYDGYFYTPKHYYVDGIELDVMELYNGRYEMYDSSMKWYTSATLLGRSNRDLSNKVIMNYITFREKGRLEQSMNKTLINSFFHINSKAYENIRTEHRFSLLLNACDGLYINLIKESKDVNANILKIVEKIGKKKYMEGLQLMGISGVKAKEILGYSRNELDHYIYKEKSVGTLIKNGKNEILEALNIYLCFVLALAFRAAILEYIGYNIQIDVKDNAMNLINDWLILEYDLPASCSAEENQLIEFLRMIGKLKEGHIDS